MAGSFRQCPRAARAVERRARSRRPRRRSRRTSRSGSADAATQRRVVRRARVERPAGTRSRGRWPSAGWSGRWSRARPPTSSSWSRPRLRRRWSRRAAEEAVDPGCRRRRWLACGTASAARPGRARRGGVVVTLDDRRHPAARRVAGQRRVHRSAARGRGAARSRPPGARCGRGRAARPTARRTACVVSAMVRSWSHRSLRQVADDALDEEVHRVVLGVRRDHAVLDDDRAVLVLAPGRGTASPRRWRARPAPRRSRPWSRR